MSRSTYSMSLGQFTALMILVGIPTPVSAESTDEQVGIEQLQKSGWQVAGFTSTCDNRSALVLFRHPSETYLVQCLTGYDVTRTPRVYVNCYKLR